MQLITPVDTASMPFTIDHSTPLLSLGSCFADEIGSRLQRDGFLILCNPFGTLYNPLSIAAALQLAIHDTELTDSHLVFHNGLWHSWMHHSRFSSPDRDECLARCNKAIHDTHNQLQLHPLIIITFGTAWIFHHNGRLVANCHKLPAAQFERRRLSVNEIVDTWTPLLSQLTTLTFQTIFTVSPIRHMADSAHGNQLSKSTLLLAIDQLSTLTPPPSSLHYFPAYEILLDELRDYRFYARDMCHPSELAADIVYERLLDASTTPATRQQALLHRKQTLRANHKQIIN